METKIEAIVKKGKVIYSDDKYFRVLFSDKQEKFYREDSMKYARPMQNSYVNCIISSDGKMKISSSNRELLYESK